MIIVTDVNVICTVIVCKLCGKIISIQSQWADYEMYCISKEEYVELETCDQCISYQYKLTGLATEEMFT